MRRGVVSRVRQESDERAGRPTIPGRLKAQSRAKGCGCLPLAGSTSRPTSSRPVSSAPWRRCRFGGPSAPSGPGHTGCIRWEIGCSRSDRLASCCQWEPLVMKPADRRRAHRFRPTGPPVGCSAAVMGPPGMQIRDGGGIAEDVVEHQFGLIAPDHVRAILVGCARDHADGYRRSAVVVPAVR